MDYGTGDPLGRGVSAGLRERDDNGFQNGAGRGNGDNDRESQDLIEVSY